MKNELDFDNLIIFLKKEGFSLQKKGAFVTFQGHGIKGGFHEGDDFHEIYPYINGKIAADNIKCFNKWRQCPVVMNLPVDAEKMMKAFDLLATEEGFKISNNWEKDSRFPYEMEEYKNGT